MPDPVRKRPPSGPVIVLPPRDPGAPSRRFRLRPGRLYALLALGAALGAGLGWLGDRSLRPPPVDAALAEENRRLSDELASLRQELDAFRAKLAGTLRDALPEEEPTAAETGPRLAVPIPALSRDEQTVRVAMLRTSADAVLEGDELFLEHTNGVTTPMQGRAVARVSNGAASAPSASATASSPARSSCTPIRIGSSSSTSSPWSATWPASSPRRCRSPGGWRRRRRRPSPPGPTR